MDTSDGDDVDVDAEVKGGNALCRGVLLEPRVDLTIAMAARDGECWTGFLVSGEDAMMAAPVRRPNRLPFLDARPEPCIGLLM